MDPKANLTEEMIEANKQDSERPLVQENKHEISYFSCPICWNQRFLETKRTTTTT